MAVPSTSNFNLNFDQLIDAAFARVGGEQSSGYDATSAERLWQVLQSDWTNRGMQNWASEPLTPVPLVQGQIEYDMPADCVDVSDLSITNNFIDIKMAQIGRAQYQGISNKRVQGRPNQYFVRRDRSTVTLYLYPVPTARPATITGWYRRRLRDINSYQDDLDLPPRYIEAAISGMAYFLGRERPDVDEGKLMRLREEYMDALQVASDADQDKSPLYMAPDLTAYMGGF
jgi:hypothetical protein